MKKHVEIKNTLKGSDYIYNNPKKRAEDLMEAFTDKSIKWLLRYNGHSFYVL